MGKKPRIVVLGDLLYDCFVWAERLPRKGESLTGYDNGFFSGGKGANQAVQAAKLGAEVYLVGKVGKDSHGKFLLSELENYGVHTEYISIDAHTATGTCCIHVARDGSNAIIIAPMANEMVGTAELEKARPVIETADVFISQLQLPNEVVKQGLSMAKNAGVMTVFDPAPPRRMEGSLLAMADYFTPNETEAEFYAGIAPHGETLEEWCKTVAGNLQRIGVRKLMLTLGSRGVYYDDGNDACLMECLPADPVDTTGAGDSFAATFAFAMSQGKKEKSAIRYAMAAAALATTKKGSQAALPVRSEVESYLRGFGGTGILAAPCVR